MKILVTKNKSTHTEADCKALTAATVEGREAYLIGEEIASNPYEPEDECHVRWERAYTEAQTGRRDTRIP